MYVFVGCFSPINTVFLEFESLCTLKKNIFYFQRAGDGEGTIPGTFWAWSSLDMIILDMVVLWDLKAVGLIWGVSEALLFTGCPLWLNLCFSWVFMAPYLGETILHCAPCISPIIAFIAHNGGYSIQYLLCQLSFRPPVGRVSSVLSAHPSPIHACYYYCISKS